MSKLTTFLTTTAFIAVLVVQTVGVDTVIDLVGPDKPVRGIIVDGPISAKPAPVLTAQPKITVGVKAQ